MKTTHYPYSTSFDSRLAVGVRSFVILLAVAAPVQAGTVAFIQDTIIDSANSYPNDRVEIADGFSGPTSSSMVSGGTVRGFGVFGSSVFEITGGASTFLSDISDSATMIMRGGEIACTTSICLVIDYDALLHLNDNSSLQVYGGTISGPISLSDQSTAHFYGTGLQLSNSGGSIVVEGTFNGANEFFTFGGNHDTIGRIFLHEVPEAPAWLLGLSACLFMTACTGRPRKNA